MVLLAGQYGWQPFVTGRFTRPDAIKTVTVLACEGVKARGAGFGFRIVPLCYARCAPAFSAPL